MNQDDSEQPYKGLEKRRAERRTKAERREMIRWEPDKPDRRSGKDRRKVDYSNAWDKVSHH